MAEDRVRVLLAADDEVAIAHVASGAGVAITAASVRTLRSLQLKGRAVGIDAAAPSDPERARQYLDAFLTDIHETDGTPIELAGRMAPAAHVAFLADITELFDQTPGPAAGSPFVGGSR